MLKIRQVVLWSAGELGASRWDPQKERGFDFLVMRDPWGNEFCVLQEMYSEQLAERTPWP
jgi:Glyoxalase-like domain